MVTSGRLSLSALHVYPVKACAGISVASARVLARGLEHDRAFMIVRADTGAFVTQREHPVLATMQTSLVGDALVLSGPRGEDVRLPHDPARAAERAERVPVRVWEDVVLAAAVPGPASDLVSEVLGFEARLVVMPPEVVRAVDPTYGRPGDHVSFADGFPVLLASESSLADLGAKLAVGGEPPVPMSRFRPNVVVRGAVPWDEDRHARVRIGRLVFRMPKRCARCSVVTIDQATGERAGVEPLRTLGTFRRDGASVFFGSNLVPEALPGAPEDAVVRVGDEVAWLD